MSTIIFRIQIYEYTFYLWLGLYGTNAATVFVCWKENLVYLAINYRSTLTYFNWMHNIIKSTHSQMTFVTMKTIFFTLLTTYRRLDRILCWLAGTIGILITWLTNFHQLTRIWYAKIRVSTHKKARKKIIYIIFSYNRSCPKRLEGYEFEYNI